MDFVLEVFDHFAFDKLYATVLPSVSTASLDQLAVQASASATSHASDKVKTSLAVGVPKLLNMIQNLHSNRSSRYGVEPVFYFPPTEWATQSILGRDNIIRQALSLFVVTTIFGWILYLGTAYVSYKTVYDHENFKHPKYLKNQMGMEIAQAVSAIPGMTALTVPWFVAEVQGYGKLYDELAGNGGWTYLVLSFPLFIMFTDCLIYMIHRWLHSPSVYKHLHKPHHKWIVSTPFASHAFHPVDGYLQSLPYHIFPFVFPLQKFFYLALFGIVNIWTVLIHDGEYLAHDPVVNGSACHTIHHLYFNYNYGQYTTLWDRLGGTHRTPDKELFDPTARFEDSTYKKQVSQMEKIQKEVEGDDERVYATSAQKGVQSEVRKR